MQHYAAQTIDNVATQDCDAIKYFSTYAVASALMLIVEKGRNEGLRGTAASALSRIVRTKPSLMAQLADKAGLHAIAALLSDSTVRVVQDYYVD